MTFTYDLSSSATTDLNISKVRLELGDTIAGAGVRTDGSNLSDEEIQVWLTAEGSSVMLAAARACEMLARDWARVASIQLGPRREALSDVAKAWAEQAKTLRTQYGPGLSSGSGIVSGYYQTYADVQEAEPEPVLYEDAEDD